MATALILLAGGKGTRMKSALPKVLHEVGHAPLLAHALKAGLSIGPDRVIVVTGHGAADVGLATHRYCSDARLVHQQRQDGTAHAVGHAAPELSDFDGDALVLYGDTPFITTETLAAMQSARSEGADLVVLGFEAADPGRYGRLVESDGSLQRIVEFKDATDEERQITLCNSGVVLADARRLMAWVNQVGNDNKAGEFYLTDIVEIAQRENAGAVVVRCEEVETLGVNSRAELSRAEALFQARARAEAQDNGVTLLAPDTVFFALDTTLEEDVIVEQNVIFGPGVSVESGARIRAFTHLEGAHVQQAAIVGPYARLRPGAEIGPKSHVGNFVEIKNATLGEGAKANHLTYVGDAHVGARSNIGAGAITCNYDGVMKHRTEIGEDAFIGSNTMLVAPVSVGDRAMTATGSVITRDVPSEALAVARARQDNKPGFAARLKATLTALKAKRETGKG